MDIIGILNDYSVPFQTEGHKHCRPGWANMECPFCTGNVGLHLGVSLDGGHFYCWRCGWKPQRKALAALLNVHETQVGAIIREYGGVSTHKAPDRAVRKKAFKFPSDTSHLQQRHKTYLHHRGFDADKLEREWLLMGTGPMSQLDGVNYSHRIVAPINWEGQPVTFQGRDITDRHKLKYMACPKERELIHHKHIIYGNELYWGGTGICVEGITDVWRLGPRAFAVLGIEYTNKQIRRISKAFDRVAVVFDDDPQAIIQAEKMVNELRFRGLDSFRVDIKGDPGGLSDDDAKHLVSSIL